MHAPASRLAWGLLVVLALALQSLVALPGVPIMLPLALAACATLLLDLPRSFELGLSKGLGSRPGPQAGHRWKGHITLHSLLLDPAQIHLLHTREGLRGRRLLGALTARLLALAIRGHLRHHPQTLLPRRWQVV